MWFISKIQKCIEGYREKIVPFQMEISWNEDTPEPYILSSGRSRYLAFGMCSDSRGERDKTTLIEFINCRYINFGSTNKGHIRNLFCKKRVSGFSAHIVENSKWIAGIKKKNEVSMDSGLGCWENARHYVLIFADIKFECIADGYIFKKS